MNSPMFCRHICCAKLGGRNAASSAPQTVAVPTPPVVHTTTQAPVPLRASQLLRCATSQTPVHLRELLMNLLQLRGLLPLATGKCLAVGTWVMNGIFCSLEWAWLVSKKSKIDVSMP